MKADLLSLRLAKVTQWDPMFQKQNKNKYKSSDFHRHQACTRYTYPYTARYKALFKKERKRKTIKLTKRLIRCLSMDKSACYTNLVDELSLICGTHGGRRGPDSDVVSWLPHLPWYRHMDTHTHTNNFLKALYVFLHIRYQEKALSLLSLLWNVCL